MWDEGAGGAVSTPARHPEHQVTDKRHQLSYNYSEQCVCEPKVGHLGGRPLGGGWGEGAEPRAGLATRVFQARQREGQEERELSARHFRGL